MTAGREDRTTAFVGLGSNLEEPVRQIELAIELLKAIPDTELVSRSSLYRSAPLGTIAQPDFVNAVARIVTVLNAHSLLQSLQEIEHLQGRVRGERWGPRVLDLDLLVYGSTSIDQPTLTVPHPGIAERNFVLLPLQEIAPDLVIPGLGCVSDIAVNRSEPRISRID